MTEADYLNFASFLSDFKSRNSQVFQKSRKIAANDPIKLKRNKTSQIGFSNAVMIPMNLLWGNF